MKIYSCSVILPAPLDISWEYLTDPKLWFCWHPDILSYKELEGNQGEFGGRRGLRFRQDQHREWFETIMETSRLQYHHISLDTDNLHHIARHSLRSVTDHATQWTSINELYTDKWQWKVLMKYRPKVYLNYTMNQMNALVSFLHDRTSEVNSKA
ncbi:MAG: SRPBCC family protein [Bacteroidota bacterium]